jgi:biopolymer transport protein ExbD
MTMTPMIDVCFQIIIFFIASMRVILPEGDFNITMPVAQPAGQAGSPTGTLPGSSGSENSMGSAELPSVKIQLLANSNGELAEIRLGNRAIGSFKELRRQVRELCNVDRGPAGGGATPEVDIGFDYNLKYAYVMDAVTSISGYVADDKRTVIRMIDKIRFGTLKGLK